MRIIPVGLLVLLCVGCAGPSAGLWAARNAALADGRIHVGMRLGEFAEIWQVGDGFAVSESHLPGHRLTTLDVTDYTQPRYPGYRHVVFMFDNGVLASWHEY